MSVVPEKNRLGDERLDRRLVEIQKAAATKPSASFPELAGSKAAREGIYRFLNNRRVTLDKMLAPHFAATVERLKKLPTALIVHDSSEFKFTGDSPRPGLGRMPTGQGFLGHFALAISADGHREPLGVAAVSTLFRDGPIRKANQTRRHAPDRESLRWRDLVFEVEERAQHPSLIHVMDREADSYELLHTLQQRQKRYIIRLAKDRFAQVPGAEDWIPTSEQIRSTTAVFEREIQLSRRSAKRSQGLRRGHPTREGRRARIQIGAQRLILHRPRKAPAGLPKTLTVHIVRVWEPNPPTGEEAVNWVLLTSEPIETEAHLAQIVDNYRARWMVEEFFKALKTGCSYEKRQLENRASLLNALGLFIPIAWQMLALRSEARRSEPTASHVISPTQIKILRHLLPRNTGLNSPSAKDLYAAIAEIGGHISNNGDPGWLVLTRGFTKLIEYETIWKFADSEASTK